MIQHFWAKSIALHYTAYFYLLVMGFRNLALKYQAVGYIFFIKQR